MYSFSNFLSRTTLPLVAALAFCLSAVTIAQAATLEQRAVYTVKILPAGDAAEVGQCSAFAFGDISDGGTGCLGGFVDNEVLGPPALSGGDGIAADGLGGTLTIETGKTDASGNTAFSLDAFQMDPYLATPGGTFKTTMTPPDGALNGGGSVDALGGMTLDVSGRSGVAQFFEGSIGVQPWNIDDSTAVDANGDPITNEWEPFVTGRSSNFDPAAGDTNLTLTGRPIGDENTDGILDAVLVSVGNVGESWPPFDGTPYSEAFNVQFELISAKPVANPDLLVGAPATPLTIDIATDLLANDTHATGDTITLDSFTQPVQAGSAIVDNGNGTLTYTPDPALIGANADSFTYTIIDTVAETDTTTVTINLATGNPPVANDINFVTDEDTPLDLDPTTNDSDPDGDPLTIITFDATTVAGGTVVDQDPADNILTYNPLANFSGPDSFGYTITDGNGNIASATVFVTVNPVNDGPECQDVSFNTGIDEPLPIDVDNDLLSTCSADAEGDTLTLAAVQTPTDQGGNVSSDGAGTLTYTPAQGFSGEDRFTYTVSDGTDTDTKTITVNIGKILGNFTMINPAGLTIGGTNDIAATWDGSLNTAVTDTNFNMTIGSESDQPFNGFTWDAHNIRAFGPGSYSFDTTCSTAQLEAGIAVCGGGPFLDMTVGAGQTGAHMLFDWNTTINIDVVLVWDEDGAFENDDPAGQLYQGPAGPTPALDSVYDFISRDVEGDGVPGAAMVDGSFIGFRANFNLCFSQGCPSGAGIEVDVPAATISSPSLGGQGCTLGATSTGLLKRSDWLIVAGFVGWFALAAKRRRHKKLH